MTLKTDGDSTSTKKTSWRFALFKTSESIKSIAAALSKAQLAFPDIPKDKTVKVKMKSGGEYSYKYAELSSIVKATRKPLSDNELSLTQGITKEGDVVLCVTKLLHSSGEWFETSYPVIYSEDDMQGFAGGFTFSRRYGLSAMLGVATEEDTDGNGANQEKDQSKKKPPADPPAQKQSTQTQPPAAKKFEVYAVPPNPLTALEKMELGKFIIPGGPFRGKKLGEVQYDDIMNWRSEEIGKHNQKDSPAMVPALQDCLNRIAAYHDEI